MAATLTAKLVLTSSDATTDNTSISVTDSLTVEPPIVGCSKAIVSTSAATTLVASGITDTNYVYIRHAGDGTTSLTVSNDAGNNIAHLAVGEFMWLPVKGSIGIEVLSSGGTTVTEYAYWTKQ